MRYIVKYESMTGHCCFMAAVVDTHNNGDYMCECFDQDQAEQIASALNDQWLSSALNKAMS